VPDFVHNPVMVAEVLAALRPAPGGRYADGTLGGAGHASAVLTASSPTGWLFGFDRDGVALEAARERLAKFAGRFELHHRIFDEMAQVLLPASCDGVLLDLGVSSPQLDRAERGFSFQADGPLDMRMDARQSVTAAQLVNELPAAELADLFWKLGEEPKSRVIARAIEQTRTARKFTTTGELAALVEQVNPRRGSRVHPATRVFQALRMAVNDELGSLERGLQAAWTVLKPGGRLAVITFHSLEDRMVKDFGRERARDYTVPGPVDVPELRQPKAPELLLVTRKPVVATEAETAANPRARSAKLRVFEKIF
jgi:16S rRNA (cytosine1402-N4)-methyltransferase